MSTPGPWYVEQNGMDAFRVKSEDHGGIAFIHDPLARELGRTQELRANAALIAAAPDLLELAKRVALHFTETDAPLGEFARVLIARANRPETAAEQFARLHEEPT